MNIEFEFPRDGGGGVYTALFMSPFKGLASKLHFKMTMMSMDETSDLMSQAEWCPVLVVSLFQGYSFFLN